MFVLATKLQPTVSVPVRALRPLSTALSNVTVRLAATMPWIFAALTGTWTMAFCSPATLGRLMDATSLS